MNKVIKESDILQRNRRIATRLISEGRESVTETQKKRGGKNISFGRVQEFSNRQGSEKLSNQIILESNPNISRALQILTGLILCPNGGSTVSLLIDADKIGSNEEYKKNALAVSTYLTDHFTNTVKLQNKLSDIVYNVLSTDGAHATVFIPDSNIDNILDSVGVESEIKQIEKIEHKPIVKADKNTSISLVQDVNILKLPTLKRNDLVNREVGLESKKAKLDIGRILNKRRLFKSTGMVKLTTGNSEVASPLIKTIPSEAIKPIIFRGEKDSPYGFLILLDDEGYPIEINEEVDFDKDLRSLRANNDTESKQITKIANNFTSGKKVTVDTTQQLYDEFNRILEADVYTHLTEGKYAEAYSLSDDTTITSIMFHRYLKKLKTKLLFVPERLVNYFTFETDHLGVGRSIISKTKVLSNLYTVLFYANFMGNLSNAIPQKEVIVDMDDDDLDQNKTLEMVINELITSNVGSYDFNYNGPSDVIRNLQKHGVQLKLRNVDNGELPNMNVEVVDKKRDIQQIDSSFLDEIRKLVAMRIGFSPELIDSSYSPEFSSQIVRDNDITARQVSMYSSKLADNLTDYVVKNTLNDPNLINGCLEVMSGGNKEGILEEILTQLTVTTPTLDSTGINEKFEVVEDNIKVIEVLVETLLPDTISDGVENMTAEHIDSLRDMVKTYFMQDYIRRNSSFKHLVDKIRTGDGLKEILDGEGEFKEMMMSSLAEYIIDLNKVDKEVDEEITKAEEEANQEETSASEEPVEGGGTYNEFGDPNEGEEEQTPPEPTAGDSDESGDDGTGEVPTIDIP